MNPLLAITAAKLGSNILGSIAGNSAEKGPTTADIKKAAFAQVLAKATNTPEYKNKERLSAEGIGSRSDVEMTLQQMSQNSLQSPEIAKALEGGAESFDLKFLPDGNVSIKKADGTERVFSLDGSLKETAQKAVAIIESAKIAYPGGVASSKEPGGSLHIVPGSKATLQA
ncbi:MAG: hypothetical protein ACKOF3_11035 [Spartobacteria bacterium]